MYGFGVSPIPIRVFFFFSLKIQHSDAFRPRVGSETRSVGKHVFHTLHVGQRWTGKVALAVPSPQRRMLCTCHMGKEKQANTQVSKRPPALDPNPNHSYLLGFEFSAVENYVVHADEKSRLLGGN